MSAEQDNHAAACGGKSFGRAMSNSFDSPLDLANSIIDARTSSRESKTTKFEPGVITRCRTRATSEVETIQEEVSSVEDDDGSELEREDISPAVSFDRFAGHSGDHISDALGKRRQSLTDDNDDSTEGSRRAESQRFEARRRLLTLE